MTGDRVAVTLEVPTSSLVVHAPQPMRVSQKTSEAVLGIPRRVFLESLASFRTAGGRVDVLGKLRLVEPSAFLAWLGRGAAAQGIDEAADVTARATELGLRAGAA